MLRLVATEYSELKRPLKCDKCGFGLIVDRNSQRQAHYVECPCCGNVLKYVPQYKELDDLTKYLIYKGYDEKQIKSLTKQINNLLDNEPPMCKDVSKLFIKLLTKNKPLISKEQYHKNLEKYVKVVIEEAERVYNNKIANGGWETPDYFEWERNGMYKYNALLEAGHYSEHLGKKNIYTKCLHCEEVE